MGDDVSKRRWFRFSLRTLFVIVTVLALWLGYHGRWVWQRRQLTQQWDAKPKLFNTVGGLSPSGDLPWSLRIFGEQPREFIELEIESETEPETAKIRALFPESWIQPYKMPSGQKPPS